MLILTRKFGESIVIGEDIVVTLLEQRGAQVRVGIQAPKSIKVFREEIYLEILAQNKKSAELEIDKSIDALDKYLQDHPRKDAKTNNNLSAGKVNLKRPEVEIVKKKKE